MKLDEKSLDVVIEDGRDQQNLQFKAVESMEVKIGFLVAGVAVLVSQILISNKEALSSDRSGLLILGILFLIASLVSSFVSLKAARLERWPNLKDFLEHAKSAASVDTKEIFAVNYAEASEINRRRLEVKGKIFNFSMVLFTIGLAVIVYWFFRGS